MYELHICPHVAEEGKCPYGRKDDCKHDHPHDIYDDCFKLNESCKNCIVHINKEFIKEREMEL